MDGAQAKCSTRKNQASSLTGSAAQLGEGAQSVGLMKTKHLKMPGLAGAMVETQSWSPAVSFKEKRLKRPPESPGSFHCVSASSKHVAQLVLSLMQWSNVLGGTALTEDRALTGLSKVNMTFPPFPLPF